MTESMNEHDLVAHIDAALDAGESAPEVDFCTLLSDLGTLLCAASQVLHLRSHDFVAPEDVRPHVEMILRSTGSILIDLGGFA